MADLTRVQNQVIALIVANTRNLDGTPIYSADIGDKARAPEEIEASCYNAAMMVGQAVCESISSPFRTPFMDDFALAHGEPVPFHYGDTTPPTITPYLGAPFTLKGVRRSYDRIESYRNNPNNAFGPPHNLVSPLGVASPLAGYYDIVNGLFYFTGYTATMKLADFDRNDIFQKLAVGLEPTIIDLACGLSAKDGDTSDGLFAQWYGRGMAHLGEIKAGSTVFQPTDDLIAARGANT